MRFNLRWLNDYFETTLPYDKLLEAITMAGHEVEESLDLGAGSGSFVFGEILELQRHPNADKLSLCKVRADGDKPLQIVCGAQNIAVGQRVPLAKIGAVLPDGTKLKPTKIRGVDSEGMMCSARELGVAEDADGIWIQPEDSPVGQPFDALVGIKVTPNRPDVLSLIGLSRDLSAKVGGKLKMPEVKFTEAADRTEAAAKVVVDAKEDCPRYSARVIRNVKIGPSPLWLQRRIEAAGLRPINNVVDVTNYVMLEMGHPLHAFDLKTVAKGTVVVRLARPEEKIKLLDGTEAALEPTDLVIADAEKAIALAGIMGGANTGVTESTTTILLEAAYFRPSTIRRTSKRLGKSTDASYRFERGTDSRKLLNSLHRAAQLIGELGNGEVLKGHLDVVGRLPEVEPITLRIDRVRSLSGLNLTGREIADVLGKLGFEVRSGASEAELVVTVPSHRPDIFGEADLVEEVARIVGYERIPYALPTMRGSAADATPVQRVTRALTDELVAQGLSQAVNFSFVSEGANAAAGFANDPRTIRVLNPLVAEQSVMRRSLVPSILQNVVTNLNQSVESIRLFEVGRTYAWVDETRKENDDPKSLDPATDERLWLTAVVAGGIKPDWRTPAREYDFFDIKGVAQAIVDSLGIGRTVIEPVTDLGFYHPGRAAAFLKGGQRLCWFGELHPAIARELDIKKRVYILECPLDGAILEAGDPSKYRELPRTPSSRRDIALVVDSAVRAQDMERTIRSAGGDILNAVRLFDLYEGKHIEAGKKSIAFALTFRDPNPDATLTEDKIADGVNKVLQALEKKHNAVLRG